VILVALYRQAVERAFDDRLDVFLKSLVAALVAGDADGEPLREPGNLGEPRFDLPLSGWYWEVRSDPGGVIEVASDSLAGDALDLDNASQVEPAGLVTRGGVVGPDGERLRYVERLVTLSDGTRHTVAVAADANEVARDVTTFGTRVAATLGVFGIGLVLATVLQVRVGLKPLERLRTALQRIRTGETGRLEGSFPSEIQPLADELNAVVESNREVVERARTHVGNLAHALKTPLSVILNEARAHPEPFAAKIVEQAEAMQGQIGHQLDRARIAAQRRMIGVVTEVGPVVEGLARAMRRIHEQRAIEVTVSVSPGLKFRGEQQDLEEMVGNLLDNACKWAHGNVGLTADALPTRDAAGRRTLRIVVDDDGPGLAPDQRAAAFERGRRLDETVPGSGLGLAIVRDLAALYGGGLELGDAPAGGLSAVLRLPAL
jgi:signal transduction histidine kinase